VSDGSTPGDFKENKFSNSDKEKQEKAAEVENKIDWQRTK